MSALFSIVLPIFALIGAGALARHFAILGPDASRELNRFVVYLALPALLFEIMAKAKWVELDQPGFIGAFGLGCAGIFALTVMGRLVQGRALPDASLDGLNAAYANVGFIGFSLSAAAFGAWTLTPATISSIITVCILFAIALALVEAGGPAKASPFEIARRVMIALVRNPLVLSPILGAIYAASGIPLFDGPERFLTLLANAAGPCALVSLGLFLGEISSAPNWTCLSPLVVLKLVGQPLLTWVLAKFAFHLSSELTGLAVILAALPTGTGPYMLAALYGRDASITAGSVLISTIVSIGTISALLMAFGA